MRMVNIINTRFFLITAMTILWVKIVDAQVPQINKNAPILDVSVSGIYTDNLNPTMVSEQSATGFIIAPKGQLVLGGHASQFLVDYSASLQRYKLREDYEMGDSNENFYDYRIKLLSRIFLTQAWHLDTQVQYFSQQQKYGTGISQLRTGVFESDQLKQLSGAVSLVYGNDTTSRFISFKVFGHEDSYQDNNDYSNLFNTTNSGAELNLAFRQSTATKYLLRMSGLREDYDSEFREDSDVYRAMLGISWRPSGKTSLEVLLGRYWRDNETSSNAGLSWTVNYLMEPSSNWNVAFNSARFSDASQSELTTDSVTQYFEFSAEYYFSEQWRFGVAMNMENTEFNLGSLTTELDERGGNVNISLILKDHSWIKLAVGRLDKNSSDNFIDYSQIEARLTWQLEL